MCVCCFHRWTLIGPRPGDPSFPPRDVERRTFCFFFFFSSIFDLLVQDCNLLYQDSFLLLNDRSYYFTNPASHPTVKIDTSCRFAFRASLFTCRLPRISAFSTNNFVSSSATEEKRRALTTTVQDLLPAHCFRRTFQISFSSLDHQQALSLSFHYAFTTSFKLCLCSCRKHPRVLNRYQER